MLGTLRSRDLRVSRRICTVDRADYSTRQRTLVLGGVLAYVLAFLLVQVASAGASITLYPIPTSAYPTSLVAAGDGNLWFTTERTAREIGEITPSGTVSLHPFTFPFENSEFLGVGPGGRPLLTDKIQQVTGNLFSFDTATVTYNPLTDISNENEWITGAVTDPSGAIWYDRSNQNNQIDRISPEGPSYPVPFGEIKPVPYNGLEGLAIDNNGTFWMLAGNGVVSMTANGVFTLYPSGNHFLYSILSQGRATQRDACDCFELATIEQSSQSAENTECRREAVIWCMPDKRSKVSITSIGTVAIDFRRLRSEYRGVLIWAEPLPFSR